MPYSTYEFINTSQQSLSNVFAASIQNSAFHWHKEYELIGILKGTITEQVQQETIVLREGDILLVNPNVIHAIKSSPEEEKLCMIIQIKPELFASGGDSAADLRFYLNSTDEEIPECGFEKFYQRMARIIYESMSDEKYAEFRTKAEVYQLIADLFQYAVYDVRIQDTFHRDAQAVTISVIDYMEKHLEDEKIVEAACHEFGISRKTMDRNLKMTIGVTGKEIVDSLRIDKAKNLLKNTGKNMNYILDVCGFGSEKTFYRAFRQETGLTPGEFRERGKLVNYHEVLKGYLDVETPEVRAILRGILQKGRL